MSWIEIAKGWIQEESKTAYSNKIDDSHELNYMKAELMIRSRSQSEYRGVNGSRRRSLRALGVDKSPR